LLSSNHRQVILREFILTLHYKQCIGSRHLLVSGASDDKQDGQEPAVTEVAEVSSGPAFEIDDDGGMLM